jgi:hypothetical protein
MNQKDDNRKEVLLDIFQRPRDIESLGMRVIEIGGNKRVIPIIYEEDIEALTANLPDKLRCKRKRRPKSKKRKR